MSAKNPYAYLPRANTGGNRERVCPICGKTFLLESTEWVYRRGKKTFCTWSCMRAFDKAHAEKVALSRRRKKGPRQE